MQFVILLTGVFVFVFYLFTPPPIFFNTAALEKAQAGEHGAALAQLQTRFDAALAVQRAAAEGVVAARADGVEAEAAKEALRAAAAEAQALAAARRATT